MEKLAAINTKGLRHQPYDAASNIPTYQDPYSGKGGVPPTSKRPYKPKLTSLPSKSSIPNIRPVPVSEKDLLTTKSNSILNKVLKPIPGGKK